MPYIFSVNLSFALAVVLAFSTVVPLNSQDENQAVCSTYSRCNELGTKALQSGRVDEAIEIFKQQAALAELADIDRQTKSRDALLHSPYKLAVPAYNNLALAYFKKHDYFWARAWTDVALRWDKNNSAAQFNLRKIEQAVGTAKLPPTTAGGYVQYAGRGTWESFIIKPASESTIKFCFSGLWWGAAMEAPAGIGYLSATIPLHDNHAEYSTREFGDKECHISMKFSAENMEVKQTGEDVDCGFGHNVTANGTFERISSKAECPEPEER